VGTELLCLLEAKVGFCPIPFFVIIGENLKVTVPIGECDLEMFEGLVGENTFYSKRNREPFTWTFETECGKPIDIIFVKDKEEDE